MQLGYGDCLDWQSRILYGNSIPLRLSKSKTLHDFGLEIMRCQFGIYAWSLRNRTATQSTFPAVFRCRRAV